MKAAVTAVCLLLSGAYAAQSLADEGTVYVWVDKDGTPHYQDRPPEGAENAQELKLRYRLSDPQALAAAAKSKSEMEDVVRLREQQQREEQSAAEADRQSVLNEREEGCAKARERAQKYETAHRLYKPGPDGQRIYLSDAEIDRARLEARRAVEEWCGE